MELQLLLPTRESEVRSRRRKRERKTTTLTIERARAMMEKAKLFPPHGATTRNVATIVLCAYLVRTLHASFPPLSFLLSLPPPSRSSLTRRGLTGCRLGYIYISHEKKRNWKLSLGQRRRWKIKRA
jgi:hypothetical protein